MKNHFILPETAQQLRNNLNDAGFIKHDKFVIRNTNGVAEQNNEKSMIDILEMIDDVNLATDYFETHIIFEHWLHDNLPSYWIPVSKNEVVRRAEGVTWDLLTEVMKDARPRRVSMTILTLEALKQASIKDIPKKKGK